jgi:hypothetical protein
LGILFAFTATVIVESKTHALGRLSVAVSTGAGELLDDATSAAQVAAAEAEAAALAVGTSLSIILSQARQIAQQLYRTLKNIKVVPMPRSIIPNVANHVATAQSSGQPAILTRVTPAAAAANRRAALAARGPAGPGKSWDEYPFASGRPPGVIPSVVPVPATENFIQGGIISVSYRLEKITPGTPFVVIVTP